MSVWRFKRSFLQIVAAFLVRDLKLAASYRLQMLVQVTGVLTVTCTFFFLAVMLSQVERQIPSLQRYGGGYFGFALVGVAFSGYLDAALRSFSAALRQAQLNGTFQAMVATHAPLSALVAGSGVYALGQTTLRVLVFMLLGAGLFDLPLHAARWGAVFLIMALTLLVTLVFGIFAAGFVVRYKQGDPVTAAIAGVSWLLSGVVYPRDIFPTEIQAVAWWLPMTHTLEATRLALLTGAPLASFQASVVYLGCFSLAGLPLSMIWFARCVWSAKKEGSLAHY